MHIKITPKQLQARLTPYIGRKSARTAVAALSHPWNMGIHKIAYSRQELQYMFPNSRKLKEIRLMEMLDCQLSLEQKLLLKQNGRYVLER